MKRYITKFLNNYSPWHLRKVIRNLENNFKESKRRCEVTFKEKEALETKNADLQRLLDKKEDLKIQVSSLTKDYNRLNDLKENLLAENEQLKTELTDCQARLECAYRRIKTYQKLKRVY